MGKAKKEEEAVFLRKKITLLRAFSLLIGSMVGSGIFISPKGVLKNSGNVGVSLIVWFACGILSLFGALSYAELGTRITKSGGHYIYVLETLGPLPSFLYLWAEYFAIRPANSAVISLAFGNYILEPFFAPCAAPLPAVKLVALLGFYTVLILNSWSVSWSARLQNVLSVIKLLALALIIVPGMMLLAQGHTENFQDAFSSQSLALDKLPLAFYAGMFAYSGWFQTSFVREELVRPERNNPLAVIVSVVTVIVGYMLTNVSYYTVLTAEDVLASQAVAVDSICGFKGGSMASSLLHDPHPKAHSPSSRHVNVAIGYRHGVRWRHLPPSEFLQLFPMALHRISHTGTHHPSLPSPRAAQAIQGSPLHSCLLHRHLPLRSGNVFLLRPSVCQHWLCHGFKWFSSLLLGDQQANT
ncbi:cystine/glutamate transporter-like isoform X2 [Malaclemys terrapin pileata]|uniref:cystine/glutamate transporter-like isoform X2 n=1 Tax=Malaclemys terrapin pileata TaxID=2991368 RepID=UPI0023A7AAB7|nr:cystine/glutamate transporter-like isoform X2 [Malaclemys terrapin pileata]